MTTLSTQSTVRLRTGNAMPVLGLGTWQLTRDTAGTIAKALELGYPMIDTSGDYGTQPGIGKGIRRAGVQRDAFYLVTKVEEDGDAYEATQNDLAELGLEFADLMLLHRPPPDGAGEDLWRGLIKAKQEGLTRDIGVSNYSVEQMQSLIEETGEVPVVNQIEWTPFGYGEHMSEFCRENDIVIQAYSPLTRTERLDDKHLIEIAKHYGKTPAQVLIRWNLQRGVVPLPKANRAEHLEENLKVFDFELSEEDLSTLDGLNERYSSLGSLPYD
jgi:diketogulonate reductase-like aldo/keto reductase